MKFDSFLIIDDSGHKRTIKITTRKIHNSKGKKVKKPSKSKFVVGEVGNGKGLTLSSPILQSLTRVNNVYTTFHPKSNSISNFEELYNDIKSHERRLPKSKKIALNKMMKYRSKRLMKLRRSVKDISKSTIRNFKKYLSVYGDFSLKSEYYILDEVRISLQAYDENVFKHLYFMDSKSGLYVNVADYILINMMSDNKQTFINGDKAILLGDYIDENEIVIVKGIYDKIYFIRGMSI